MIAKITQTQQRHNHVSIRLVHHDNEGAGASDELRTRTISQNFDTLSDALRYALFRLDDINFKQPEIWNGDRLVLDYNAIQMYNRPMLIPHISHRLAQQGALN